MHPTVRYRHLATVPEAGILLPESAMSVPAAYHAWRSATQMAEEDIILGSLSPIPLPRPSLREQNWSMVDPQTLFCPLFWLPERLTTRRVIELADGTTVAEPVDQMLVRIALELTTSGVYTMDKGWVDVMAMHGIDLDSPEDLQRVRAWQDGDPDATLDTISLDPWLDQTRTEDPDWASTASDQMFPTLSRATWAICADSIIDEMIYLSSGSAPSEPGSLTRGLAVLCALAVMELEGTGMYEIGYFEQLETLCRQSNDADVMEEVYEPLMKALHRIRDIFWPDLEEVASSQVQVEDQVVSAGEAGDQ